MKASKKTADGECRALRKRWTTDAIGSVTSLLGAGSVGAPAIVRAESASGAIGRVAHGNETYLDLRGWDFTGLSHARFERVDISCATMSRHGNFGWDATFDQCLARNLTLRAPSVFGDWRRCDLSGAVLDKVDAARASFAKSDFSRTTLKSCVFVDCSFEDCVFDHASWTRGRMSNCSFTRTAFRGSRMDSLEVSSCTFIDCTFEGLEGSSRAAANTYSGCLAPTALAERDALDEIATGEYRRLLGGYVRDVRAPPAVGESVLAQVEELRDPTVASRLLLAWLRVHGGLPIVRLASAQENSKQGDWQVGDEYLLFPLDHLLRAAQPTPLSGPPPRLNGVVRYSRDASLLRAATCWSAAGSRSGAILVEDNGRCRVYLHWVELEKESGKEQRWRAITLGCSVAPFDPHNSSWLTANLESDGWERREYRRAPEGVSITTTDSLGPARPDLLVRFPT
jgi:uncharacterized protein YjbI with pentapeptide repeats